jgi:hypothetical protein
MASDTFSPQGSLRPDWSVPADWSEGTIPGAGATALVNAADAYIDPQTVLSANIVLEGGAALIGNGGGFSLAAQASLQAEDLNALYANGAIVNQGVISVTGPGAALSIVVQAGAGIANLYGLTEPSFENAGGVTVAAGATLNIAGTEFSNTGTVLVNDGVLVVDGGWVDGGQGPLIPGGTIEISGGGDASFTDGVTDQNFTFNGAGTLNFGDVHDVWADGIAGFAVDDEILTGSVADAQSLLNGGLAFTTAPPQNYSLAVETLAGGAAIVLTEDDTAPACFARGTGILTPAGYVPVENLVPGTHVVTIAGGVRAVRWLGWRAIDLVAHPRPDAVRPVRILANALGDGVPARELVLSPDHALFLEGRLVPVKLLVNGATIRRDARALAVTYFHIELDRHDILLAENLAVESYLDTGNRQMFENARGQPWRSPVFGRGKQWDAAAYAELCLGGPVLRGIRKALFNRTLAMGYLQQTRADLCLLVDGQTIQRGFGVAQFPCFRLNPGHSGLITIRSASFVPAEMSAGQELEDDWRRLGVAIRRVMLDLKSVAAREIARAGFHPRADRDIADWTDGNGVIAVAPETTIIGLNISALPKTWQVPLWTPSHD